VYIRAVYGGRLPTYGTQGGIYTQGEYPYIPRWYIPLFSPLREAYTGGFHLFYTPRGGIYGRVSPVLHPSGRLNREVFTCFTLLREAYGGCIPPFSNSRK